MLLGDIISGKENSHLVLIHDNVNQNGKPLLCCFVKSLLERTDYVHVILWDVPPQQFVDSFDSHLKERIYCYDGFSDPLGWNLTRTDHQNNHVTIINQDSDLAQMVKSNIARYCVQNTAAKSGDVVKVAVIFNSLSRLLLWKSSTVVCTLLNQLYSNPSDSQQGYQVAQVVALVHSDLHDDHTLNTINFLASSLLWITQDKEEKDPDRSVSWCKVLHKRKTGKVIKKFESFSMNDKYVLTEHEEKDWNGSSSKAVMEPVNEVDPTQNLTFNLTLTDDERQARSKLKLPYMYHEEKRSEVTVNPVGEGKVFYQPDEADDFDEDDPDEDLNI